MEDNKGVVTLETLEGKENRALYVFILIFAILAAGIVTAGYIYYRNYERQYRVEVEHQLSAIAELKVGELVQFRTERLGDAAILFKNGSLPAPVRGFFENPKDGESLRAILNSFPSDWAIEWKRWFETGMIGFPEVHL
jgi:hypothetical protein